MKCSDNPYNEIHELRCLSWILTAALIGTVLFAYNLEGKLEAEHKEKVYYQEKYKLLQEEFVEQQQSWKETME